MNLSPDSLVVLRVIGVLIAIAIAIATFARFRKRGFSRLEAGFRWLLSLALALVAIEPNSINWVVGLLRMERAAYGRMLALLVLSNLGLWVLLLRERSRGYDRKRVLDRLVRSHAILAATPDTHERLEGADVLVAMPALNESDNVAAVLDRIPKEIHGRKVGAVVIDDGSTDGTPRVVREAGFAVVSNPFRRGQGAALRLAYDLAKRVGASVVVTLDADGQHKPEEIENVVGPVVDGDADFVIGSRLLGVREKDSLFRLVGIHANNWLINFLAGTKISDCSSGFKAIRVKSVDDMRLEEDQFQAAEAIISAAHSGLRIVEAPITVLKRASGESKKGRNLTYGFGFVRTILKTWWR